MLGWLRQLIRFGKISCLFDQSSKTRPEPRKIESTGYCYSKEGLATSEINDEKFE